MALRLRSPQQVFDITKQYCEERRAKGFSVLVTTVLPRSGRINPDDFEGRRQDLNVLLRERWREFADGLIDVAADRVSAKQATNWTGGSSTPTACTSITPDWAR